MRCSKCGTKSTSAKKFCAECGSPLILRCPRCATDNKPASKFCEECGTPLTGSAVPSTRSPQAASATSGIRVTTEEPDASTADGERKTVTALFADIKGSTELIEHLDPEEARAIVDPVLRLMIEAVHRYGGYVAQSTGDGIFALFGAPAAYEDYPQHALHAALAMRDAIRECALQYVAKGWPAIESRVGVSTGEVVVRSIETGGHAEYAPIGLTTNLASRLQAVAAPGSIAASGEVRQLCDGYFNFREVGRIALKGIAEPVEVYEVTGVGPLRTHFERSAQRGLTKFVGREREIAEVLRALNLARHGYGQIVAAVAEAGSGKSRLLYEFKRRIEDDCLLLETGSVAHGKASAYQPILEMLYCYFGIQSGDDVQRRRNKVVARLTALDPVLEYILPYLTALLGIDTAGESLADVDSPIRRRRMLDTLKQIFLRESLDRPVIVMFEDLHWIDDESQAFLNLLADSIANARILLLINYRPEYRHEWGSKSYYTQLRLDPLGKESAGEMLTALLGTSAELEPLKRLVIARTIGNPFFIEEMVQALTERGVLVRGDVTTVSGPLTRLEVPPTVQRILASRIDRLETNEKELLQTLAVIGLEFPLRLIQRVTHNLADSDGTEKLEHTLSNLQLREFIFEQPALHDVRYRFKHALTQEVAYNSVLGERRRHLHERTAAAIESLFPDRLDDHLSELARHYSCSSNVTKASNYLHLAGRQAAARSAHSEALAYFGQGMKLLEKLPTGPERVRLELMLQIGSGFSYRATKGFTAPEVERTLLRARELCTDANENTQLFDVLVGLHTFYMFGPRLDTSRELAKQLLVLGSGFDEPSKLATAFLAAGQTDTYLGDFHSSRKFLERTIEIAGDRSGIVQNARGYLAPTLWSLGYPQQAGEQMTEALAHLEESNRPLLTANVLAYAATLYVQMRLWQAGCKQANAGMALAIQHGFQFHMYLFQVLRGRALTEIGDVKNGTAEMIRGAAGLETLGAARPFLIGYVAEGYLKAGKPNDGLHAVLDAIKRTDETGERWTEPDLHRIKGELLLAETPARTGEAERCFRTSIEIAVAQAAKSFQLRASNSMARMLLREGHRDEARAAITPIYSWFKEGHGTPDLQDASALLLQLSH